VGEEEGSEESFIIESLAGANEDAAYGEGTAAVTGGTALVAGAGCHAIHRLPGIRVRRIGGRGDDYVI